jgi:hypothetical protein
MRGVIIDNCAIDAFVDLPGAYEAAVAAVERGDLEIRYVHTTLEEAAVTPDEDRRKRLLLVLVGLGRLITSSDFVFGVTRFGHAAFGGEESP